MSHPLNNPYASGNQISTQVQSQRSITHVERDPRRAAPRGGSGLSLDTGGSSGTSSSCGEKLPSMLPQSASDGPCPSRSTVDYSDIERSVDLHISRAREAVKLISKPTPQTQNQPAAQNTQRDKLLSSGTGTTSSATSSTPASFGHFRQLGDEPGSSSLDWMSGYKRPAADDSHRFYSSASSWCTGGPDSERESNKTSIPGLGDLDYPPSSTEPSRPKYTSQSAAGILWHFGLEKEDLEHLISFPDDQITPDNLPFIIRQIRNQKAGRTTEKQDVESAVHRPGKVIEYGHTSKYSGGTEEEDDVIRGSSNGSVSVSADTSDHGEERLPGNSAKHGASSPSCDQASPFRTLTASWSSILNSNREPTRQAPRPDQSSVPPHSSKPTPARDPEAERQAKTNAACTPFPGSSEGQGWRFAEQEKQQQMTSPPAAPALHGAGVSETPYVMRPAVFVPADLQALVSYIGMTRPPSIRQPSANAAAFKGLPPLAMMHDYAAASPAVFPHTCSLCGVEFAHMKDWISHQNDGRHLQRCKVLRRQYPEWDGEIEESRPTAEDAQPSSSVASKALKRRHKKTKRASRSRSCSPGARRRHGSEGKKKKKKRKSRSRSPQNSRHAHRSRSRSPRCDHPSSSHHHQSRSKSHEKRSPGARTSGREKRSNSAERLAKKLLETSAVQSQSGLEDVVKTLAMTLAKINSSSTSSSKGGKRSSSPPSPRRQKSSSAASSSLSSFAAKKKQMKEKKESFQESEKICYVNKAGRSGSLAPTMVKLHGILNVISHDNVVDAMERFGKTKSVVLFRSKREALVCFEREEDAKELKSYKTLNVNGFLVTIIRDEASQEQNKLHQKPELSVGSAEAPAAAPNVSPLIQHIQKHLQLPTPAEPTAQEAPPPPPSNNTQKKKKIVKTLQNLRKKYLKESDSEEAGPDRAAAEETPKDSEMTTKTPQEESAPDPGGPTVGELLHQRLNPGMICCRKIKNCFTEKFAKTNLKLLMVTNLPVCGGGGGGGSGYTEGDVARLLKKFGFEHKEESMFVLPQTRMAFFMMPTTEKLQRMLVLCRRSPLWFRGCQLCLHVVASGISMSLFGFYKSLMKVVKVRVTDNGVRTVYARNISQSETRHLRAALTKIGGVRNFLPLLNRVYVEFKAVRDADRFGVWYSQQDPVPRYQITRLMTPNSCSPLPPKLLKQHLNSEDVTEATVTMTGSAVPQGSIAPFWITLKTSPFVFPTVSPWFKHPEYLTISEKSDVEKASLMAPTFPTVVMVTGLPEGNYKQQDVAKLVWPYFSKQDIYAVYYHVMVLTLQRRAFVYFTDWGKCCEFVNDHLTNPLCVHGNKLTLHFLLQRIHPKYSEDVMYRTLMEWSNTPVLEPDSLEERLLSAYIFHTTVDVVKQLMEVVASIAPVVNFVPLANRICIEMANANAARKVLDECCYYFPANTKQRLNWNLVGDIESVKSFRKRLQDSSHIRILLNSEPASNQPHAADNAASTASTAAPSAAAVSKMDEVKQEESEVPMETDAVPEAAKRKEPATSSEFNSAAALLTSSKTEAQLPHMNKDIFRILTAAVRQHRLIQEDQDQGRALAEDDFTSDNFSSDAYMFESQEFNMDDFVTVDEIGEVEDANSKSRMPADIIASSTPSSRSTREGKGVSSTARHVSAKTSGDSSSPSSSSKDTKSSQRPAACYSAAAGMKKTRTGSVQASKEAKTHPESLRAAESDHAVSEPTNTGPASGGSEGLRSAPAFPLESGFNENICLKKRLGKIIKKDEVENFQVLDSLAEQKGDERNDGGQDGGSELQRSPPQESQTSHVETFQVLDSVEDEDKTSMENSNKMEAGGSFMLLDGVKEDQEETQLKDEIPASTESVQDVSKASRSQISNENQLPEHSKDAVKESDWATGEEDTFEIVDSIEDQTASEDDGQTLETPNDQNADEDIQPTGEDEGPAKRSVASKPASNNEARLPKTSKTCEMEDGDTGVQTKDKEVTEETVYEIIDSVEEEAATTREESGRRRSSRRKKEEKLTNQPEAPEKVDKDKEATYKILDSVEDEAVNDDEVALRRSTRGRKGRTKTEETSTRKRQIPARDSKERNAEKTPKKEDKVSLKESPSTKKSEASEEEEEATYQILDSVEDEAVQEEPPAAEKKGRKRRRKDEIAPHIYKPAKKIELLKTPEEEEEPLYQVVDSLEDDQVQENLTTADEPDGGKTERGETEDKVSPKQEAASAKAETPTRTSDENGVVKEINGRAATAGRSALMKLDAAAAADVSREERASPCGQTDAEIAEDDLLTLDEIVDEEEEEPKTPELHPQRQEDESVHSLKPETLMTVGALSIDEEEKLDEEGEMSKPAKRRDSRDECETFVTVDETGKEEEEEEVLTPRTRGRAKKRCRQSPAVRKSSRGKKERTREEEEKKPPPTSLCSSFSLVRRDGELENQTAEAERRPAHFGTSSAGQEQPEPPGSTEPEAKRPRAAAFRLPPFRPNNPLGLEFLVPKFGFFCNVCSEFFLLEKISKELHCSSQTHYHNLEKYFQKLQQTSLSSPTQSSVTGSASE